MGTKVRKFGSAGYTEVSHDPRSQPMDVDTYFSAVLMAVGPPPKVMLAGLENRAMYHDRVLDAMIDLSRTGPRRSLGYADFLNWCSENGYE